MKKAIKIAQYFFIAIFFLCIAILIFYDYNRDKYNPREDTQRFKELKDVRSYVDNWLNIGININTVFADDLYKSVPGKNLDGFVAGACFFHKNIDKRYIAIDRFSWDHSAFYERVQIYAHEMGHCALSIKKHDDTLFNKDNFIRCPKSIMRFQVFTEEEIEFCFLKKLDYYKENLHALNIKAFEERNQ